MPRRERSKSVGTKEMREDGMGWLFQFEDQRVREDGVMSTVRAASPGKRVLRVDHGTLKMKQRVRGWDVEKGSRHTCEDIQRAEQPVTQHSYIERRKARTQALGGLGAGGVQQMCVCSPLSSPVPSVDGCGLVHGGLHRLHLVLGEDRQAAAPQRSLLKLVVGSWVVGISPQWALSPQAVLTVARLRFYGEAGKVLAGRPRS